MGKAQKDKGHRFELKVAADATVALGKKVTRTIQFRGGESEGSDVVVEPFAIECKHYKKLGGLINRAYEQAKRDAREGYLPGRQTRAFSYDGVQRFLGANPGVARKG